jgi:glutathione S-transferase
MFCIKDGEAKIAPEGTAMSHLEWFEAEGWVTKDNLQEFMESTIRGVFIPARHALFFYKGVGFFFDDAVVKEAIHRAKELMSALVSVLRARSFVESSTDRSCSEQSSRC